MIIWSKSSLRENLSLPYITKTMFMRNIRVFDAKFSLNGTNISECSNYVYPGRKVNMANGPAPELGRRKRATWTAFKSVEEVVKKSKNVPQYIPHPALDESWHL
ncbi:unnamed protein product [Heligmosomoides polygyrus]|uniref:Uncharacterized protein n=1 Tax=Heligmosomoides polygyrus TaxID=6339 RepID=A0A183FUX2_HELPZ|nr:unnamed protein product [Heligmosomoides polygyrus]